MREEVPRTDGLANTLTLQQRDNYLCEPPPYITPEDAEASKCVRAGGHGLHYGHTWDVIAGSARIRKLTPRECLRLQGWRDGEINKIRAAGVSNAQQYRQAGNGITVTVLIAIFGELFNVPYAEILDNWRWRDE
jgi:DNA (cytosine-5)-methyltransferase 1